jgi:negative regulator of flagellin synthesis FlgM
MKIENNPLNRIPTPNQTEGIHPDGKAAPASSPKEKDTPQLSEQSRLLAKAYQAAHETPDARADRVEDVKKRVTDGNYTIPPQDLARHLLSVIRGQKD